MANEADLKNILNTRDKPTSREDIAIKTLV